jgi:SAM-dependent methyltransferase
MGPNDLALLSLGRELQACNYRFTTITPTSHHRVNARPDNTASPLQRVFGWSRPFKPIELSPRMVGLLRDAGELRAQDNWLYSNVRFSSLGEQLFAHSAFPTEAADSVFFGPDTYRFARALRLAVRDVGCGSGVGGIHAATVLNGRVGANVMLSDINPKALRYSRINAELNGVPNVRIALSDVFGGINEGAHLIISNPPYLVDPSARLYRHGGGNFGFELSLRIVEESVDRLYPGGLLFLYTGTPVVDGVDQFFAALRPHLEEQGRNYTYEEIDPDVFGEQLESAPYDRVDRIAVVALTIRNSQE